MKRVTVTMAAMGLLLYGYLSHPIGAMAQESVNKDSQSTGIEKQKVSLDLESSSLYSALKLLFSQVKCSFTLDESLKGLTVSAHFTDVPFRTALNTLLKSTSTPLTYRLEDGIYSVGPKVDQPAQIDGGNLSNIDSVYISNMKDPANIGTDVPKVRMIRVYNVSDLDIVQVFGGTILNIGLIPLFGQGGTPAGQNKAAQQNTNGFFDQGKNMIGTGHGKIIVVTPPAAPGP